ncbi:hypothetical protein ET445_16860 [Agromyces protaetiae]|uniref:Uncharacterized protein n=1 Tax=Agromyces protaetiae TaxID=2509455 RepID=A0A4P6FFS2_9MICO|nr:hypothetical protein [Agromyces protaetiae]QAY74756.1 hypothetical protein ET445_16860 [Agromyces protaetiae]
MQIAIVALPLVGIAAWSLQQPDPGLRSALAASAIVVFAVTAFALVRYRRTEVSISRYGVVERGFFGRINSVAARDVASVVRLDLYRGASDETSAQLFVVGRDGRCLLRMRGAFWECEAMDEVAATLEVDEVVRTNPMTVGELRRSDPGFLYWFERFSG